MLFISISKHGESRHGMALKKSTAISHLWGVTFFLIQTIMTVFGLSMIKLFLLKVIFDSTDILTLTH